MHRRVVLGLGSNVGDRVANVRGAADSLRQRIGSGGDAAQDAACASLSPLYENAPLGGPPQGDFLNAALLLVTDWSAPRILDAALDIERQFGRIRRERWGARTLDIDILWIEGEVVDDTGLTVPHPGLLERVFALKPLVDVAPDARDPRDGRNYADVLQPMNWQASLTPSRD